jgi:glucose-6-phosphate 1-dehydrogenase
VNNPLRDPDDRRLPRVAGPCGLVLFGVTGDLARKKIMPAIYDLANRGLLPPGFALVALQDVNGPIKISLKLFAIQCANMPELNFVTMSGSN